MVGLVSNLWERASTPEGRKVIRYTAVSAISFVTAQVVLTVVYGVLRLWSEVPSTLFANVVAGVPSYILNRQWVWKKGGRSHLWKEVVPFWVTSLTGIGLAMLTASWAHTFADEHHLHHLARTVLVDGANIAAFGSLWFVKFLILNRLFASPAFDEPEEPEAAPAPTPAATLTPPPATPVPGASTAPAPAAPISPAADSGPPARPAPPVPRTPGATPVGPAGGRPDRGGVAAAGGPPRPAPR